MPSLSGNVRGKNILEWSGRNRTIPTYMQNAGPTSSQHDFQLALRSGIMETRPFNRFAQQRHHLHRLYVRKGWKLLQSDQTRTYGIKISGPSRNLDGAKSTDIFRTLFDCGRMLSFRNAFAIFESAIRDGHASRQQIIDYCDEPYVGRKRELAISVAQHAIGISENGGESFCLATMIEEGVALPTQQVEFVHPVSGERRRADYVWHTEDGRTIVGELDGQDKYVNPTMTGGHTISDIVEEERLRSDTLRACGVDAVVRFTFLDAVRRTPLINKLRAAGIPFTAKPSLPHHR